MTNGDRIRQFTDEQLAEIISEDSCPEKIDTEASENEDCKTCWLNFLRREVNEND